MDKISKKIEIIANLLIIIFVAMLGFVFVQKYLLTSSIYEITPQQQSPNRLQQKPNSPIQITGVDFSLQPKTLILALQVGCFFCTESASFYKQLIQKAKNKNIKLVAVLPTSVKESTDYLNKLGIKDLEVRQAALASVQARGTPTLILINNKGEIIHSWIGKLKSEKEAELLSNL